MSPARRHAVIAPPITVVSFNAHRRDAVMPVRRLPVFAHRPMGTQF